MRVASIAYKPHYGIELAGYDFFGSDCYLQNPIIQQRKTFYY